MICLRGGLPRNSAVRITDSTDMTLAVDPRRITTTAHWGLGEIDGLLVPPGKASKLLTSHLIIGKLLKFEPAQEKWFSQTIHTCTYKPYWFTWVVYEAHFDCHDIQILGKSPIKWRQHPDMTFAVDWDVKHQFKQTKKQKTQP